MDFDDLYTKINEHYMGSTDSKPVVLTLVNSDGTVTAVVVDGAAVMDTGHPDGSGARVTNLIIYPKR